MIICASCNARNVNRSAFCIRCGAALVSDTPRDVSGSTDAFAPVTEDGHAALVDKAAAQLADGHAAQAIANCRRAIALNPGAVEAHAVLGMAYEQTGELAAALEAYETVVALAPQRAVEAQKAALLKLRIDHNPAPPTRARRANLDGPVPLFIERVKNIVSQNPPLYYGLASGLVVFILGAMLLVHASRAQANRALQAQYTQELQMADLALGEQRYAEACAHYSAAWNMRQDDSAVMSRWQQAYQLSQNCAQPDLIAQMPKYIPNMTGRNPFAPVPIGGQPPAPAEGFPGAMPGAAPPAVAPPPVPPPTIEPRTVETYRDQPRVTPPSMPAGPGGRRDTPSPIQPVGPSKSTATTPKPPPADTTPKPAKGEVTIWVSDKPTTRPATTSETRNVPSQNNADALRSRGESLAREGRVNEAVQALEEAESGYQERARQDPSSAAINNSAAASCRARIRVLRSGQ